MAGRGHVRRAADSDAITPRRVALWLALVAGVAAVWLSTDLFPYRSINHDEGVYLQQAAMLLDGQLVIDPPVDGALRPWFFVADDGVLYPKYAPIPAAIFAVGLALGDATLALGIVAASVVALTYASIAEAFEPRVGLVAAAILVVTPLFVIQSSVFLPYLPTLALLLVFAWAYLRADRTGDRRWAALAGAGAGLAFFARPYTAALFATPFVVHALWTVGVGRRDAHGRQTVTAAVGFVGVALALGYNWLVTGAPLTFPYQAFAPLDGPGFGRRELLDHAVRYDLTLAFESAWIALETYVGRWTAAAPIGALAAAVGLALVLRRGRDLDARHLIIAGLVPSVVLGQLAFWGTLNAIGSLADPKFGLLGHLGPFYHLPLLVPTVAFAAVAVVAGWDRYRSRLVGPDSRLTAAAVLAVAVLIAGVGGLAAAAIADPVAQNRVVTASYESAYGPIEAAEFDRALVFLPTPYGNWLAHPFQYLRNDPGFDGEAVYAQDRGVFAVLDGFPERTAYRYAYRGDWSPVDRQHVTPTLRRVHLIEADAVRLAATVGVPPETAGGTVTLANRAGDRRQVELATRGDGATLTVRVENATARLGGPGLANATTLPVARNDTLEATVYVDTGGLDSFEYELALPIDRSAGTVRAVTPRQRVCRDVRRCGVDGAYVPGAHGPEVGLNATVAPA